VNDVRRETAGMQRKILGSWKQYYGWGFPGFFPVDSNNFQCFSAESDDFPASFLEDPMTGKIDLG
jgi:hypothetical protein